MTDLTTIDAKIEAVNERVVDIQQKVGEIQTSLFGRSGSADNGLYGTVVRNTKGIQRLNNRILLLVGFLVGSGVLAGGLLKLFL